MVLRGIFNTKPSCQHSNYDYKDEKLSQLFYLYILLPEEMVFLFKNGRDFVFLTSKEWIHAYFVPMLKKNYIHMECM